MIGPSLQVRPQDMALAPTKPACWTLNPILSGERGTSPLSVQTCFSLFLTAPAKPDFVSSSIFLRDTGHVFW